MTKNKFIVFALETSFLFTQTMLAAAGMGSKDKQRELLSVTV